MTSSAADLAAAEALAQDAGLEVEVVPLFETVDDLRAAPQIVAEELDRRPREAIEVAALDTGVEVALAAGADAVADDPQLGIERRVAEIAGTHTACPPCTIPT